MTHEPDDLSLAIRASDGDSEALAELIERTRLPLFALAFSELRHYEDAQDAVASALFHICRRIADLRNPDAIRAWINSIVRNETRRMGRIRSSQDTAQDTTDTRSVEDPLLRIDVERALRQLPKDQASAMGLFYLSQWPITTIANHMARPEGTIKRWLHYGRRHLAAEMKGHNPMEHVWRAYIVAPETTPVQLQCVCDALKAAGWADARNVAEVKSLEELYILGKDVYNFLSDPDLPWEEKNKHLNTVQLAEPLSGVDFLILGEQIAGRSAFEFVPVMRAIAPQIATCILIQQPYTENTILASYCTGFNLCITSDADMAFFQHSFWLLRKSMEPAESTG